MGFTCIWYIMNLASVAYYKRQKLPSKQNMTCLTGGLGLCGTHRLELLMSCAVTDLYLALCPVGLNCLL